MEKLILETPVRNTQFTCSNKVAHRLSELTAGKVKVEDAGFDWKILGPDPHDIDFVAYVCDQVRELVAPAPMSFHLQSTLLPGRVRLQWAKVLCTVDCIHA